MRFTHITKILFLILSSSLILSGCSEGEENNDTGIVYIQNQIQNINDYEEGTLSVGDNSYKIVSGLSTIRTINSKKVLTITLYASQAECSQIEGLTPLISITLEEISSQPYTFDTKNAVLEYKVPDQFVSDSLQENLSRAEATLSVRNLIPPEVDDIIEVELSHERVFPYQLTKNAKNQELKLQLKLGIKLCSISSST